MSCVIIVVAVRAAMAKPESTTVTELTKVLDQLSEMHNIIFSYSAELLDDVRTDYQVDQKENAKQAVTRLFASTRFNYHVVNDRYYIIFERTKKSRNSARKIRHHLKKIDKLEGDGVHLKRTIDGVSPREKISRDLAQHDTSILIQGHVRDVNGIPLIGANVLIKGTAIGTTTDIDGAFSLDVPADATVLSISYTGFESREIEIHGTQVLDIVLATAVSTLDQVVVVGYGQRKKVDLTGAVFAIDAEQINQRPVTNATTLLAGMVPGLTVLQKSGRPGANAGALRIRGIGTLGNSNPLVIVDGIEADLQDVDVNDIDNISVLKDASAAAIYGVRAANGVVLVTTKRGSGRPVVQYHGAVGSLSPFKVPDRVDAYNYALLHNAANEADGKALRYTAEDLSKWQSGSSPKTHPDNDQFEALLASGDPTRHFHNLSVSGSNDATQYYLSLGYSYEGGLIATHGYDRLNYRINLDQGVGERLNVGINLAGSFAHMKGNTQSVGQLITEAYRHHPGDAIRYPNGTYPVNSAWGGTRNMVAYVSAPLGTNDHKYNDLIHSAYAEYELIPKLRVKAQFVARNDNAHQFYFRNYFTHYRYDASTDSYPASGTIPGGIIRQANSDWDLTSRLVATYAKQFNKDKLDLLVGLEQRSVDKEGFTAGRSSLVGNNNILQLDGVADANDFTGGNRTQYRFRSLFASANYNIDNKYLLEANLRYDGTSRFPKHDRYALFPSFSAAWRISEEKFFKSSSVDHLKLRASWGKLGNQEIGDYAYLNTFGITYNYVFGGDTFNGIGETARLANSNITWETTTITNIGLDLGILNGKIAIVAEYFIKNTRDILLGLPQPSILGAAAPVVNAGSVSNKGFEFGIDYNGPRNRRLTYHLNANVSFVKNKITDLKGTDAPGRKVGDPIQNIFGYVAKGIFNSQAEIDQAPDQSFFGTDPQPGDINYADLNNDNVVDANDRQSLGSFFPKTSFGLQAGVTWKSLNLSMVWQGFANVDALTQGPTVRPFDGGARPTLAMINNTWSDNNRDAELPRLSFDSQGRNYQTSSFWVEKASFVKLRNLQLGYTIDDVLGLEKIRFYLSGENLLYLSGIKDVDPEFAHGNPFAWNNSNYPSSRLFMGGVNVTF